MSFSRFLLVGALAMGLGSCTEPQPEPTPITPRVGGFEPVRAFPANQTVATPVHAGSERSTQNTGSMDRPLLVVPDANVDTRAAALVEQLQNNPPPPE